MFSDLSVCNIEKQWAWVRDSQYSRRNMATLFCILKYDIIIIAHVLIESDIVKYLVQLQAQPVLD